MKQAIDLTKYRIGGILNVATCRLEEGSTEPPPRYTEATLLEDMTQAWKFAANEKEREALKLTNGIGTARTREPVITMHQKKQNLIPGGSGKKAHLLSSPAARIQVDAAPEALKSVTTTAKFEMMFTEISEGRMQAATATKVVVKFTQAICDGARRQKEEGAMALPEAPPPPAARKARK